MSIGHSSSAYSLPCVKPSGQRDRGGDDDEPASPRSGSWRAGRDASARLHQALRRVVDAGEHHVADEREDDRVGVQRAQAPEGQVRRQVRLPEGELQRDEHADEHADDAPARPRRRRTGARSCRCRRCVASRRLRDVVGLARRRGRRGRRRPSSSGRSASRSACSKSRWRQVNGEQQERADDEHQAHEDLQDQDLHRRLLGESDRDGQRRSTVSELAGMSTAQSSGDMTPGEREARRRRTL